ncbi:hypothetical protein GCM10022377_13650 [Zhihengliuella alba]|uniref:PqqD family protein n=1 Tax=Zhihengliuella alba TaxID=547018 RepID=A0ABP7D9C8_9MICC
MTPTAPERPHGEGQAGSTARGSAPVRYRRASEVAEVRSETEDRHALLPLFDMAGRPPSEAPQPLVLTGSASAIWDALGAAPGEGATATEIACTTAAEFGVEPAEIETDVEQFLDRLADAGLAERVPASSDAVH